MILLLPSAPAAFHPSNPEATAAPIDTTYDISPHLPSIAFLTYLVFAGALSYSVQFSSFTSSPPLYTGSRPHVRLAISPHLPYTGGTGHCHGRVQKKGETYAEE